jgi:hypothetical protein
MELCRLNHNAFKICLSWLSLKSVSCVDIAFTNKKLRGKYLSMLAGANHWQHCSHHGMRTGAVYLDWLRNRNIMPETIILNDESLVDTEVYLHHGLFSSVKKVMVAGCPRLRDIAITVILKSSNANVTALTLRDCENISFNCLRHVAEFCPNLKSLDVSALQPSYGSYSYKWDGSPYEYFYFLSQKCPHLSHLSIGNTQISESLVWILLTKVTSLRELALHMCTFSDMRVHADIPQSAFSLEVLMIRHCEGMSKEFLESVFEKGKGFLKVELKAGRPVVSDRMLTALAVGSPGLQVLNVDGCMDITDQSVWQLSASCRNMQELCICGGMNLTDAGEVLHSFVA